MTTDLHDLIDETLADLDVPTDRLREGAMARGRVLRRRRRATGLLGGAAAAVLAAGFVLPSVAGTEAADDRVAHDTSEPSRDNYVRPAGWWDMPGGVMRDRLADLLPDGMRVTDANLGDEDLAPGEEPTGGWVAIDVAEGNSAAGSVNVLLYPPFDDDSAFARDVLTCPGNYEAGPEVVCVEVRDTAGDVVGRGVRWVHEDVVNLEVTRLLPDGGIVYAAASNSSDDKPGIGSSTDRARPPLGRSELAAVAESPTWQDWTPRP